MNVLVDSSVWIDYFRDRGPTDTLDLLIEEGFVVINDLILAELMPPLMLKKAHGLIALLREIQRQPMNIDWNEIVQYQTLCLRKGINGVGIPDLLILQNAVQGALPLMTMDKHFSLLARHTPLTVLG